VKKKTPTKTVALALSFWILAMGIVPAYAEACPRECCARRAGHVHHRPSLLSLAHPYPPCQTGVHPVPCEMKDKGASVFTDGVLLPKPKPIRTPHEWKAVVSGSCEEPHPAPPIDGFAIKGFHPFLMPSGSLYLENLTLLI
jgi:hypothetical protein